MLQRYTAFDIQGRGTSFNEQDMERIKDNLVDTDEGDGDVYAVVDHETDTVAYYRVQTVYELIEVPRPYCYHEQR